MNKFICIRPRRSISTTRNIYIKNSQI